MADATGRRPFVFVVLPTVWQVVEPKRVAELQRLGLSPADYERGRAQSRWLAVAKELGIPALDATPILAAEPVPEQLFLADGGHLTCAATKWSRSGSRPRSRRC